MLMHSRFSPFTKRIYALLVLMVLASMSVQAAEIKDLYSAEVPVHGQDDDERLQAIRAGLSTVLIKVSGQREAPLMPAVATVLEAPMQFVQQFRYHALSEHWQQAVDEQGQFYSQLLHIDYDGAAVNRLLREAVLPVWGRARPSTLIWLAVEDWNQRTILGGDNLPDLHDVLLRQAGQRGLPIILPLLDLQDQSALSFADIWGDFQDDILSASRRYQAGGVLVGRLYRQSADEWQARWTMYQQDDVQRWVTDGLQQQQVVKEGLDSAADHFAARFARLPGESSGDRVEILIHDVSSLAAYARAMQYLESLDMAKDVLVEQVDVDRVRFSLTVRGDLQGLKQAILFGDTLAPLPVATETLAVDGAAVTGDSGEVGNALLSYRLLP